MGVTIDNHIKILKSYHNGFTGYVSNIQDSIDVAIDIMSKYQKIEHIVTDCYYLSDYSKINDIKEVLEDGNNK